KSFLTLFISSTGIARLLIWRTLHWPSRSFRFSQRLLWLTSSVGTDRNARRVIRILRRADITHLNLLGIQPGYISGRLNRCFRSTNRYPSECFSTSLKLLLDPLT